MAIDNLQFPELKEISGIKLATAAAGIKQTDRDDMLVVEMAPGTTCAAVFTQNAFCAAPVIIAKQNLFRSPRWLVVNSGNANAGMGEQGILDAQYICEELAVLVDGDSREVMPFSTGVIGEILPVEKITAVLPLLVAGFSESHWNAAALAVMTTDTFAKGASRTVIIAGQEVTISGIAKGAGMIQPNMATMLSFIATDALVTQLVLQQCLQQAVEKSFNRITVDGDTSTNDACVLMASGHSKAPEITTDSKYFEVFSAALEEVCADLSEAIIRDGEGATKLIRIVVKEARSKEEALRVGKTIAHSPLVKTAFFASDPNWGRILAAVGRAGVEEMQINDIVIHLGDVCIVRDGGRADSYTEEAGQQVMNRDEIDVSVSLGRGDASEQVLTCDFSYDYVRINAEYRT